MNNDILTPNQLIDKKKTESATIINTLVKQCIEDLNKGFNNHNSQVTVDVGYPDDFILEEVVWLFRVKDWQVSLKKSSNGSKQLIFSKPIENYSCGGYKD